MENEDTEYITGEGDDFITFLFSSNPREKNTVKLELDPPKKIKDGTSFKNYSCIYNVSKTL